MTDARIPDHCAWAARGRWREAYNAAEAALRKVTAERDDALETCERLREGEANLSRLLNENARAEAAEAENRLLKATQDQLIYACDQAAVEVEELRAEVARLKAQAREDAMQLLAMSDQAQGALTKVATLRAELDAARGRVKPLVWTQLAITKEHKGLSGVWLCAWGINGQYEVHVFDTDPTHVMLNGPDIVPTAIYTTIEAAKAAAQADYTARILAALEPDPAIERMREALRPFAALAEQVDKWGHEDGSTCAHRIKACDIRRARAALKEE